MASALLRHLKQHYRAAQSRPIVRAAREPAWYIAHRHLLQANMARRDTESLWFGQALYIQFLGAQIMALEHALGDDGEETARRYAAARGRAAWQIVALAKRLCVLAQVPSVAVYVQFGRLPMSWAQLLKDLGLASLSRTTRARLVMPVVQLMPDVQDALAEQCVSGRVLCDLARRPPAAQRSMLRVARQGAPTPLARALWQQLQPHPDPPAEDALSD